MTAPLGSRQAHREATERDKRVRRWLLRISLANWGIAALAWTTSAYLGIESPARLIVYSVLFVIGLVAAILAILTYLLEKFAHRPTPPEDADHEDGDHEDGEPEGGEPEADTPAAEKPQPETPQPEKPKPDGDDAGSPPVVTG